MSISLSRQLVEKLIIASAQARDFGAVGELIKSLEKANEDIGVKVNTSIKAKKAVKKSRKPKLPNAGPVIKEFRANNANATSENAIEFLISKGYTPLTAKNAVAKYF